MCVSNYVCCVLTRCVCCDVFDMSHTNSEGKIANAFPHHSRNMTLAQLNDVKSKPLKEGTLQKKGSNFSQARSRIFRLYVNRLEYYRSRSDRSPAGVIDLNGCVDELEPSVSPTAFSLKTMGSTRKYICIAETEVCLIHA
jgi:hypothetical protein